MQRFKNQVTGRSEDNDEDYDNWEPGTSHGSGHRRPSPPRRPDDDPGSADEDDDDEKPQVVVLKEGKHLNALEATNEKRKQKGLPPLKDLDVSKAKDEPQVTEPDSEVKANPEAKKAQSHSLSFSSTPASAKGTTKKRRAPTDAEEPVNEGHSGETAKKAKKKSKKGKSLLSFGDEDEA